MKRILTAAAIFAVTALSAPAALEAQFFGTGGDAGYEIASATLKLGMLSPRTTFTDDSFGESSFANGFAVGITATTWPAFSRQVGLKAQIVRSETDGQNEMSEFAPIAVNDPTVYLYTLELAARKPFWAGMTSVVPYLSAGVGGKHYTWAVSQHKSVRFNALTAAVGMEVRPPMFGAFGINTEVRGYRSDFRAFGIDDGTWSDGFYGGKVGAVDNYDLLISTGISLYF